MHAALRRLVDDAVCTHTQGGSGRGLLERTLSFVCYFVGERAVSKFVWQLTVDIFVHRCFFEFRFSVNPMLHVFLILKDGSILYSVDKFAINIGCHVILYGRDVEKEKEYREVIELRNVFDALFGFST